jgi:hypothetical protein
MYNRSGLNVHWGVRISVSLRNKSQVVVKYFLLSLLLLICANLFSQKKETKVGRKTDDRLLFSDSEWFEGSIMLSNGDELSGLVKYNSSTGILSYQDGSESRVFTPLKVSAFEFFDESSQAQRIFYTLKYEDAETNVMRPLFFEVLKEYKTFAILCKSDRLEVGQQAYPTWASGSTYGKNTILVISQTETVYIMNANGEIKPYFMMVNSEDGRKSVVSGKDLKTENTMLDRDLLEEFIPAIDYQKLKKYGKENNLNFRDKQDFLKILAHYDQMISK